VTLSFAAAGRPAGAIPPSNALPGPGTVTLKITNTTRQRTVLPSAADAPAGPVAAALDSTLTAAHHPTPSRLPTIRTTLPTKLPVTGAKTRQVSQLLPLRLHGELRLAGVTRSRGPSRESHPRVVPLNTMLADTATFTLAVDTAGTLELDLTAVPALDPRTLTPPHGTRSWAAWAAAGPSAAERRSALDRLVQTAAIGARASAYSPYLGPHLGPDGSTVFHYSLAAIAPIATVRALQPRPVPILLALLGLVLLACGGVLIWRRS
jgi:hypothetical protein